MNINEKRDELENYDRYIKNWDGSFLRIPAGEKEPKSMALVHLANIIFWGFIFYWIIKVLY